MDSSRKIRIAFLHSSKRYAGIMRNISLIAEGLGSDQFEPIFISLHARQDPPPEFDENIQNQFPCFSISESSRFDLRAIKRIRNLLIKEDISILSCHGYKPDVYAAILRVCFRFQVPTAGFYHTWAIHGIKDWMYYFIDILSMKFLDKLIFVSPAQQSEVPQWILAEEKRKVILNAIDAEAYREKVKNSQPFLREKFPNQKLIGYIGRLSAEKNIDIFLKAMQKIISHNRDVQVIIVGDGPQKEQLSTLSVSLGISEQIYFTGHHSRPEEAYASFDIYVSASRIEGIPNTLLEAQSAELPCVISDIPAHREVVKISESAYFFNPGDITRLSSLLQELLESESKRSLLQENAFKNVQAHFPLSRRIQQLRTLYQNLSEKNK